MIIKVGNRDTETVSSSNSSAQLTANTTIHVQPVIERDTPTPISTPYEDMDHSEKTFTAEDLAYMTEECARLRAALEEGERIQTKQTRIWNLIHEITYQNSLLITKYIVPKRELLRDLLSEMTDTQIEIILAAEDVGCCGMKTDFDIIESIRMLESDGSSIIGELKHVRSDVYQLVQSKGISMKYCV